MRQGDDAPTSRCLLRCEAAQEIRFRDHPDERGAIDDGQTANAVGDDHLRPLEQKLCQQSERRGRLLYG